MVWISYHSPDYTMMVVRREEGKLITQAEQRPGCGNREVPR